jgi:transcriptional/translational regulatory protein YebC/TACO1
MHTKLPEFIEKILCAVKGGHPDKEIAIRGLENLKSAKMQSLRTGRIEHAVGEIAEMPDVVRVEVVVIPRVPETMHTVIAKGIGNDGRTTRAILEIINILHPTEEAELSDCGSVDDRRPSIGRH